MLITILDDSIPFDGGSPAVWPMGGPEKGVVYLAAALAARGHTVRVFNRCEMPVVVDGVSWQSIDDIKVGHSDWVIAHRRPELLDLAPDADRHALWIAGMPGYLAREASTLKLRKHSPLLIFQSLAQTASLPSPLQTHRTTVIVPGVATAFRQAADIAPASPARAITTIHPLNGLGHVLDLWTDRVFTRVPWSELHVYSSSLERGAAGAEVPDAIRPVLDKAMAARGQGVRLMAPQIDSGMAEVYRAARVHLHPGHARDVLCTTVADSQAVGLPAVTGKEGAGAERVRDGITGHVAPDDDAFANLAVRLLDDDPTFKRLSGGARMGQRGRGWDAAAVEFEKALA